MKNENKEIDKKKSNAKKEELKKEKPKRKNKDGNSYLAVFLDGILKENPLTKLMLGVCSTLAITTAALNGIGMGVATMIVLLFSNLIVSLLRNLIPKKVRIPAFIMIIATFVTVVHMLMRAYFPAINASLGVYLPLITVNCIVFARAETFASKHPPLMSVLDALGAGIGYTIVLFLISVVREFFGRGELFGFQILPESIPPARILVQPPGGFLVFAVVMALFTFIESKFGNNKQPETTCDTCTMQENCTEKGAQNV